MNLVWYYWPADTVQDRPDGLHPSELFASRHVDVVSVDAIEEIVYVLTANEYFRFSNLLYEYCDCGNINFASPYVYT